jgi:uncharacterized protein (DUF2147 family)
VLLSLLLALAPAPPAPAPSGRSLLGDWITPDKSIVEVYSCEKTICMRIAHVDATVGQSFDGLNPDASKRDRRLCGLVIGRGFAAKDAAHAEGGKLYDPHTGSTYSGALALADDSTLKLRGYVGISLLGRTEIWHRAPVAPESCES